MENKILHDICKERQGHYCHVLEVSDTLELQDSIEALICNDFERKYEGKYIKEFFNTITITYVGDDEDKETDVYNYNLMKHIEDNYYLEG